MDEMKRWYLDETELTINDSLTTYTLETLEDAKLITDKLNNYESYIKNMTQHMLKQKEQLESKIRTLEEVQKYKIESIDTIQKVYESKSKTNDFNTQIIALVKLDCIKEIRQQYKLITMREKEQ